jgi:hypothetical protein
MTLSVLLNLCESLQVIWLVSIASNCTEKKYMSYTIHVFMLIVLMLHTTTDLVCFERQINVLILLLNVPTVVCVLRITLDTVHIKELYKFGTEFYIKEMTLTVISFLLFLIFFIPPSLSCSSFLSLRITCLHFFFPLFVTHLLPPLSPSNFLLFSLIICFLYDTGNVFLFVTD